MRIYLFYKIKKSQTILKLINWKLNFENIKYFIYSWLIFKIRKLIKKLINFFKLLLSKILHLIVSIVLMILIYKRIYFYNKSL